LLVTSKIRKEVRKMKMRVFVFTDGRKRDNMSWNDSDFIRRLYECIIVIHRGRADLILRETG